MDNHVVGGEALRHGAADADVTSRRAHPRGACSFQRGQRFSSRAHRCFLLRVSFPAGEVLRSASQRTIPYKDSCTWGPQITVAFKLSQRASLERSVGRWLSPAALLPRGGSLTLCIPVHDPIQGLMHVGTTDHCGLQTQPTRASSEVRRLESLFLLPPRRSRLRESCALHPATWPDHGTHMRGRPQITVVKGALLVQARSRNRNRNLWLRTHGDLRAEFDPLQMAPYSGGPFHGSPKGW